MPFIADQPIGRFIPDEPAEEALATEQPKAEPTALRQMPQFESPIQLPETKPGEVSIYEEPGEPLVSPKIGEAAVKAMTPGSRLLETFPAGREFLKTGGKTLAGFTTPEGITTAAGLALMPEAAIPAGIGFGAPMIYEGARDILQGHPGAGIAKLMAGVPMILGGVRGAKTALEPKMPRPMPPEASPPPLPLTTQEFLKTAAESRKAEQAAPEPPPAIEPLPATLSSENINAAYTEQLAKVKQEVAQAGTPESIPTTSPVEARKGGEKAMEPQPGDAEVKPEQVELEEQLRTVEGKPKVIVSPKTKGNSITQPKGQGLLLDVYKNGEKVGEIGRDNLGKLYAVKNGEVVADGFKTVSQARDALVNLPEPTPAAPTPSANAEGKGEFEKTFKEKWNREHPELSYERAVELEGHEYPRIDAAYFNFKKLTPEEQQLTIKRAEDDLVSQKEEVKRQYALGKQSVKTLKGTDFEGKGMVSHKEALRTQKSFEQRLIRLKSEASTKPPAPQAEPRAGETEAGPGTGIGPGGTTEGDVGTKAQLAQLTDSIQTLAKDQPTTPAKAFTLGERMAAIKDGISDTLTGLKAAGGYLKERLIGAPKWDSFKAMLGDRHLSLSESAINARKWVKSSEKAVRDPVLKDAISNYIDTGGDEALLRKAMAETKPQYKAGYERALNLTPEEKTVAANVKNYFDARLNDAIDAGVLNEGVEDYIHRMYERDTPWKSGILAELRSGIYTGKPALAKQRVFQYDFEAEKAGYKPVKSFIKRVAAYDLSLNKAIADRQAVKAMHEIIMPDGRPMIDIGGAGIEVPKEGATEATLIKPGWKPTDAETPIKNRADFKAYDYPALQKWKWVGADAEGKPILLQGDVLVHPDAMGQLETLFNKSRIRKSPLGRAALGVSSTIKQTMLDLSGFHMVQIGVHGMEHRTFKPVSEIDFESPEVRGLIRGGLVVGDTHGYELFSEGLAGSSLTKHIPGIGPKAQAINEWLFNSYIPRLKVATGLHALERNKTRFPKLSEDKLNHLTANQMNAAFGELNYEMLGRSKTTQDIWRLALLAPDFLEARGRFAAQAVTGVPGMKGFGKEQFQALALGAVVMYTTARIANKLINDEWHLEPKNAFSIIRNGKAYSIRTVQGDILHAATDLGRFMFNRLNPVFGRTIMEAATGRDYFGRKRDLLQQVKDFASVPVPISFRGLLNPSEQSLFESFLNAFGIVERRASAAEEIYKQAETFKKENKIRTDPGEFIYDPDKDPFRSIRQAALYGDAKETAKAVADTIAKGDVTKHQILKHFINYANRPFSGSKANEPKFKASLTADQRKIYDDALKERQKVLKNVRGF